MAYAVLSDKVDVTFLRYTLLILPYGDCHALTSQTCRRQIQQQQAHAPMLCALSTLQLHQNRMKLEVPGRVSLYCQPCTGHHDIHAGVSPLS